MNAPSIYLVSIECAGTSPGAADTLHNCTMFVWCIFNKKGKTMHVGPILVLSPQKELCIKHPFCTCSSSRWMAIDAVFVPQNRRSRQYYG